MTIKPPHTGQLLARKTITRTLPDLHEIQDFMDELNGESDRAAVLSITAFLELTVESSIKIRMTEMTDAMSEEIFGPQGPLGTAGAKARVAYALGVFGKRTYNAYGCIMQVRNLFAHAPRRITFEVAAVKGLTERIEVPLDVPEELKEAAEGFAPRTTREKFIGSCQLLITYLMLDELQSIKKYTENLKTYNQKMDSALAELESGISVSADSLMALKSSLYNESPTHPYAPIPPKIP